MPEPLPPSKSTPHPNPIRYQRLDHTFTRKQWLSSVNSCRSKLFAGFPSDHYLLVTEIQVKLAQRKQKFSYTPQIDFAKVDQTLRAKYNRAIQGIHELLEAPVSDHTAKITFYTDGSGTKGRCSRSTPAGWGWTAPQQDSWLEASGPVCTDSQHIKYLGAQVGSNNTGELSAIVEALLKFALEHEYTDVVVHSDSKWSIHMIKGVWRPKTNKTLVSLAQRLAFNSGLRTHFQWVKGHSGVEGNERADRLAEQGRDTGDSNAGRNIPLPRQTTPPQQTQETSGIEEFAAKIMDSANIFPLKSRNTAKPWISNDTLRALEEARRSQASGSPNWKALRNQAKRLARKDRIHWIHEQLVSDPGAISSSVWNAIRRQRRGFQGKRTHLVANGKPVPWSKTHEAFRDHLQNTQWEKAQISDHTAELRRSCAPIRPPMDNEELFTRADLSSALSRAKCGKAPGPDHMSMELLQLLDADGEARLLNFYNHSWINGISPNSWSHATVVSIYKGKGDDSDPGSYRPISLLNATYKVYASMIQSRLALSFDDKLRHTQSGFRAGRGTRHPLFTLRRAMEWAEMTNHNLHCLFLDWKQAFDSIDHTAMLEALTRFGLSPRMIKVISSLYDSPTFQTKGPEDSVAKGSVGAGIRQGCPLSPYLFIIVLTVIFQDLDALLLHRGIPTNTWSEGFPIYDLEYADDTLLMAISLDQLQHILSALEDIAGEYGMRLNLIKTELLVKTDHTANLYFRDGTLDPTKTVVKYLGSMITWKRPFDTAFRHRASIAEESYEKLRLVWNSSMSRNSKLRIFQSTFVPIWTPSL